MNFASYTETYDKLKKLSLKDIFKKAFLDAHFFLPVDLTEDRYLFGLTVWRRFFFPQSKNKPALLESFSSGKKLRVFIMALLSDLTIPLRLVMEFPIRLMDYAAEAFLARAIEILNNCWKWEVESYSINQVLKSVSLGVLGMSTAVLFSVHVVMKTASIAVRLITSPQRTWQEADNIHPYLGVAARLGTGILITGICVGLPFLAPYFVAIHAPAIASGLSAMGQWFATAGSAVVAKQVSGVAATSIISTFIGSCFTLAGIGIRSLGISRKKSSESRSLLNVGTVFSETAFSKAYSSTYTNVVEETTGHQLQSEKRVANAQVSPKPEIHEKFSSSMSDKKYNRDDRVTQKSTVRESSEFLETSSVISGMLSG